MQAHLATYLSALSCKNWWHQSLMYMKALHEASQQNRAISQVRKIEAANLDQTHVSLSSNLLRKWKKEPRNWCFVSPNTKRPWRETEHEKETIDIKNACRWKERHDISRTRQKNGKIYYFWLMYSWLHIRPARVLSSHQYKDERNSNQTDHTLCARSNWKRYSWFLKTFHLHIQLVAVSGTASASITTADGCTVHADPHSV